MRYVLDSSVAFKWVVAERDSDKADRLRADVRAGVHDLIAPDVLPVELAHALTRAERQGRIPVGQAGVFWADAMTTRSHLFPPVPLRPAHRPRHRDRVRGPHRRVRLRVRGAGRAGRL